MIITKGFMKPTLVKLNLFFVSIVIFTYALATRAHNGVDDEHEPVVPISSEEIRQAKIEKINEEYKEKVRAIFKKSCFDCHSQQTRYPWYYKFPIVRKIIDGDVKDAKKHLDMTYDFPFKGHGTPEKDLKAIKGALDKKSMPPLRYRMMHWGSGVSDSEKRTIMEWIENSQKALMESGK